MFKCDILNGPENPSFRNRHVYARSIEQMLTQVDVSDLQKSPIQNRTRVCKIKGDS